MQLHISKYLPYGLFGSGFADIADLLITIAVTIRIAITLLDNNQILGVPLPTIRAGMTSRKHTSCKRHHAGAPSMCSMHEKAKLLALHGRQAHNHLPTTKQPSSPRKAPSHTRSAPKGRPKMAPAARLITEAGTGNTVRTRVGHVYKGMIYGSHASKHPDASANA
jgi:hypothetical protein